MGKQGNRGPPPSLMESLLFHKKLDGVKSLLWGRTHEKTAIREYSRHSGETVVQTGIWLHESGILGASPDGLIGENSTIEVKCPYSFRTEKLEEVLSLPKNQKKYVVFCKDGQWNLDRDHDYYHQIQSALYFTKRQGSMLCCTCGLFKEFSHSQLKKSLPGKEIFPFLKNSTLSTLYLLFFLENQISVSNRSFRKLFFVLVE